MRIWNYDLIPILCRSHLLAVWREGLGCYDIITCEKVIVDGKKYRKYCHKCGTENLGYKKCANCGKKLDGYFYHPAVKEWEDWPYGLWILLGWIRTNMILKGYKPKQLPEPPNTPHWGHLNEYQLLEQQIEVLKSKNCECFTTLGLL